MYMYMYVCIYIYIYMYVCIYTSVLLSLYSDKRTAAKAFCWTWQLSWRS